MSTEETRGRSGLGRLRPWLMAWVAFAALGCWDTTGVQWAEQAPDRRACAGARCACVVDSQCPGELRCVNGACTEYAGPATEVVTHAAVDAGVPGAMGDECVRGYECESGLCVSDLEGGVCTVECTDECPEGWRCELIGPPEFQRQLCALECEATEERCNGRDDDCDGELDEGFLEDGLYQQLEHCGACGTDCAAQIPNALQTECVVTGGMPRCRAEQCAPGHFAFADSSVCLPLPDNLCQGCQQDADCLAPGSRCVTLGSGARVCGRDCGQGSVYGRACPGGYECVEQDGARQCVPSSGQCACTADSVGLQRPCQVDSCTGLQTCVESGDGHDFGECSADGVLPEICDGQDNDCDGESDEGFVDGDGLYFTDRNCGACGNDCLARWNEDALHAAGYCDLTGPQPACRLGSCSVEQEGGVTYEYVDANDIEDDGCECRRVLGNDGVDPPDEVFLDPTGARRFPGTDAAYADDNCDGIDGVIDEALFVRAGAAPGGDGSLQAPFDRIGDALAAFDASGKQYILVAGGLYEERVQVQAGARLYGGYSADFRQRNVVSFPTEIRAPAPALGGGATGSVEIDGVVATARTVVSGFVLAGYDVTDAPESGAGGSSYAVIVRDSDDSVELSNNLVVGGAGGRGGRGGDGDNGFGHTAAGGDVLAGTAGQNAGSCTAGPCADASRPGGVPGENPECGAASGSEGGGVTCPAYDEPSYAPAGPRDGAPGYSWTRDSATNNNCGSHMTEAFFPDQIRKMDGGDGLPGASGSAGQQGTGCDNPFGVFTAAGFDAAAAALGSSGGHGQGGGGGASSGGIDTADASQMPAGVGAKDNDRYLLGATGGGGGAGGCGGTGGQGGGGGGASVGVLVSYTSTAGIDAPPRVLANIVQRGLGGAGGDGGFGGFGGVGGPGGSGGGDNGFWIDFRAGDGGRGGRGGRGGGGGGGCGGPSFGVVVVGGDGLGATYGDVNDFSIPDGVDMGGNGGAPGATGDENAQGAGSQGASMNVYAP